LGAIILTGFGAIWFTPEWPQFNDNAKPLASTMATVTMLMAALAALDRGAVGSKLRVAVWAVVTVSTAYALAQVLVLPYAWRLAGGVAIGATAVVMGLWASIYAWRRGDRFAPWVTLAVVLFALCVLVVSRGFAQVWGIDAFSALMSVCLMASCLVLRHVLVLRERFGRAVIGRAATHRFRDPLTALLSYEGFEREVEQLAVRQQSGGGKSHLLYFSLQALDSFKQEDGYVVWQRDLVRFAAVLQKVLGDTWHIGRLTNSKFGAVCLEGRQKVRSEELLTMVLSNCARKIDTQGWIDRVGLRMVATSAPLAGGSIEEMLLALDKKLQDLPAGKRIAQV
jgi:GGDEF domain-containing protein